MGDNSTFTPGTGKTIATDEDASPIHWQKAKIYDGTADSTAEIPGDATNGLYVQEQIAQRLRQYRAATAAVVTLDKNTAPFFLMYGGGSRTARIKRLRFMMTSSVEYLSLVLEKYSAVQTGGTPTNLVQSPIDSADSGAAISLCAMYASGSTPTAGTLVGVIGNARPCALGAGVAGNRPVRHEWDFRQFGDDRGLLVLRGTSQGVGLRFTTAPAANATCIIEVEWEEET